MARSSLDAAERAMRRLGGLAALIALAAALAGIGRGLQRRSIEEADGPRPACPVVPLAAATAGFLGASAVLWRDLPIRPGSPARAVVAAAGCAALLSGLGLYHAGKLALGREYNVSTTLGVRLYQGQRLVTSGSYAVVRRPMYLGAMVAAVGAFLLYRTLTTLAFVAVLPVLVVRARREEEALAERFGAEWSGYRERVPGWIPRIGDRVGTQSRDDVLP